MKVDRQDRTASGIRFSVNEDGREIARAYLYVMTNDLHDAPFGLLEDVFVMSRNEEAGSVLPWYERSSQLPGTSGATN